jgi:PPM family protein phosphatase
VTVLRSGSATDVGRVRGINQDMPLVRDNLYAVADGMGGHAGGEVAARVAVETLEHAFDRLPTTDGLRDAFSEANAAIWQESQTNTDLRGMGTTLTAMALVGGTDGQDVLALANVGDSRAYVLSDGRLTQVTDDHSLAEERMRHGEMTEAEAAVHPQRHILTRALGVSSEVETDMWELHLRSGDRVLLCSDGLTNEVGMEEMTDVLVAVSDPEAAASRLVEVANEHGGADNITVIVVDVQVGEDGSDAVSVVTPLALGAASATALGAAAAATALGAAAAATANGAAATPDGNGSGDGSHTSQLSMDDTLAPGARLGFGDEPKTLAVEGPDSDEFFVTAAVPVARTSTRVPMEPRPATEAAPEKESRGARRRRLGIPRRVTFRVILFVLLVAAIPVAAYFVVRWYAYDNWTVTLQGNRVVITQGQPGGVLWFHPRTVERTHHTTTDLPFVSLAAVKAGVQEPSLAAARNYINGLVAQQSASTTTTTSKSKTSTTSATGGSTTTTHTSVPPSVTAATAP